MTGLLINPFAFSGGGGGGGGTYSDEVMADSPLAYWRQGEASGTTMTDSSGNGRNGTYTAGVTLGQTGLLVGDADTCADYPGGTDWADVAYASWMNGHAAITVEAIFKPDAVSATQYIVGKTSSNWQLYTNSSAKLLMAIWYGTGSAFSLTSASTLVAGTAYYAAFTAVENGAVALYLNGALEASGTLPGNFYETAAAIRVGAHANGTGPLAGLIDEVAFYGSALSASRIAAHHAAAV